jgi:hypothetical protein
VPGAVVVAASRWALRRVWASNSPLSRPSPWPPPSEPPPGARTFFQKRAAWAPDEMPGSVTTLVTVFTPGSACSRWANAEARSSDGPYRGCAPGPVAGQVSSTLVGPMTPGSKCRATMS